MYEVARNDGIGEWRIFSGIGLPLAGGSVMAAFVLGFFEVWNMMEETLDIQYQEKKLERYRKLLEAAG